MKWVLAFLALMVGLGIAIYGYREKVTVDAEGNSVTVPGNFFTNPLGD